MQKNITTFFSFCVVLSFFLFLFSFPTKKISEDRIHQQHFNEEYKIFSITKPENLSFCNEKLNLNSDDIWERLDKELLKNVYWQSNTMLYFKRVNKFFPIIVPILEANNIPDDFKYLAVIESGLENVVSPAGASGFW